jgi:hypothetical protein
MDHPTNAGDIVVADGLPLDRLYARFDGLARGRSDGDARPRIVPADITERSSPDDARR